MSNYNDNWDGIRRKPLNEAYDDIRDPTVQKVVDYIKMAVKGHMTDKSDLEYAVEDLKKVQRALEAMMKSGKIK